MTAPPPPAIPHFFTLSEAEPSLAELLKRPHALFVEIGERPAMERTLVFLQDKKPDFALSLSAGSAYRHPLATLLCETIYLLNTHTAETLSLVETCLHEAIINAIVHGNFGLQQGFDSLDGFAQHYAQIEQCLHAEPYCSRRLHLCIWHGERQLKLSITDEGDGIPNDITLTEEHLPHGRGLQLIRTLASKVWISDNRRTLNMAFASPPPACGGS